MTREQKIEWLEKASNLEVIDQLRSAVIRMTEGRCIKTRIEGQEDYNLVQAELLRRLEG